MKEEIYYDEIEEDSHIFHMWEPLKFEIKDNYNFIQNNLIFKLFSNLLFLVIAPILFILNKILFGFSVEGRENLESIDDGKITISNHIHPMDCTMNGLINFPLRTYYPTLASNFKIPIIRHIIRILYAIPIPKEISKKRKFEEELENALKKGKTVHMYPEGSLWPYYEKLRNFKNGAFKLAVNTNKPIVPIVYVFKQPEGIYKLYKRKKSIHAIILKPIYPDNNLNKKERVEKLKNEAYNNMQYVNHKMK